MSTALRASGTVDDDGLRRLGPVRLTYADGAEGGVLNLIRHATDISADSRALVESASDWAERYHTHPDRANVVRAFDIPAEARVLEIGAGCGAVTRYLGENARLVDALEPMPARALAVRERTRDLANVVVAVGELTDVPANADYDVVVVIGVLEYVGFGVPDHADRLTFLRDIRSRLAPGGTLILAIENKLGVKYLAGAPEDHTRGIYDGIEGYPSGGRARTFSRRELAGLLRNSGFTPQVLGAFPDYKMTRVLLSPEAGDIGEPMASLVAELPEFPSPDWTGERPRGPDERSLWHQAVDAGLANDLANSFVVLARTDDAPTLWPPERLATAFATQRTAGFASRIDVRRTRGGLELARSRPCDATKSSELEQTLQVGGFVAGPTLLAWLASPAPPSDADSVRLLRQWRSIVSEPGRGAPALLADDLVVDARGTLAVTHAAVEVESWSGEDAFRRGVLLLGLSVAARTPPHRWDGAESVRDIVRRVGELAGLPEPWIDAAIETEAVWRAGTRTVSPLGGPASGDEDGWRAAIAHELERNIWSLPLGHREHDVTAHLRSLLS